MTAEPELWFDDDVEPLDDDESSLLEDVVPELEESSLEVALALVAVVVVPDWPEPVCVEPVVVVAPVLPSEPVAAMVPKAIANVASAVATTRRRMTAIRRARARRRSRTRSAFEVGEGVEDMPSS